MKLPEKKQRWVYHAEALPQAAGEGVTRRVLAYTDGLMCVENTFEKGAVGALHHHPHTQITYVVSGAFEFTVDGVTHTVRAGDTILKEDGVEHGCVCTEAGILLDIFTPMREDFVKNKMGRSLSPHGVGCGPFLCEKSGGSGRSGLGGSSLRRCGLAGNLRSSLRAHLRCSLRGSRVLLGHGRGGSSLRLSGSRSSLRGRSSSRRRAAAGSHADSQDQSSNGNTNILEFHIENLLAFEKIVSRKAVQVKPFRKKIF